MHIPMHDTGRPGIAGRHGFPNAAPFMLHVHTAMSEHERRLISARTKVGLDRAKARGVTLGRHGAVLARENAAKARAQAEALKPVVAELRKEGKTTVRAIMEELNRRGIKTLRGGAWHPHTVNVMLRRINGIYSEPQTQPLLLRPRPGSYNGVESPGEPPPILH